MGSRQAKKNKIVAFSLITRPTLGCFFSPTLAFLGDFFWFKSTFLGRLRADYKFLLKNKKIKIQLVLLEGNNFVSWPKRSLL